MLITLDLPDDVVRELKATNPDLPRDILEVYARQAYRSGRLTEAQLKTLLNLRSQEETDLFLQYPDTPNGARREDLPVAETPSRLGDAARYPLQGTAYSFEDPFSPVVPPEDWDVLR